MVNRVDAVVAHLIFPILNIISSLIITLVIGVFVVSTVGSITFIIVVVYFSAFYLLVFVSVKGRLREHAVTLNTQNEQLVALMEEIFNEREIILSNVEKFIEKYLHSAVALRVRWLAVYYRKCSTNNLWLFSILLSIREWVGVSVTEVGLLLFTHKIVPYVHGIYTSYSSLTAGVIDALNKSLGVPVRLPFKVSHKIQLLMAGTLHSC